MNTITINGVAYVRQDSREDFYRANRAEADRDCLREFVEHTVNEYGARMPSQWKARARAHLGETEA